MTTAGDGSGTVEVWSSKTGAARTGYLRASTVRRVRAWTDAAGIGNGSPLFPSMDRWGSVKQPARAMSPRAVADVNPPARGRVRNRPGLRSLAPGRGRRQHGTARGQPGSHAASRGLEVSRHARALRPLGQRRAGSRRDTSARRSLGSGGWIMTGCPNGPPQRPLTAPSITARMAPYDGLPLAS